MLTSVREVTSRALGSVPTVAQLGRWQLVLGVLLVAQGAAVLLLSAVYELPIYTLYLTRDTLATKLSGQTVLAPAIRELARLNLSYPLAAMLFATGVLYLLSATLWRQSYDGWLKRKQQPVRAGVIAGSGSLLLITFGLLAGVRDAASLAMIVVFTVTASLLLAGVESLPAVRRKQDALPHHLLSTALILLAAAPLAVILAYLKGIAVEGSAPVPTYLWWLAGTVVLGWLIVAANLYLQQSQRGKWANYLFVERCSIALVFVVETAFAWQVFAAVLRP